MILNCADNSSLYFNVNNVRETVYIYRAYPENANSNTCAPNTLKFHTLCGLCVTKQHFRFEFDIVNGSGVIAT